MASQTASNLSAATKEVYTSDQLEKQFYGDVPIWDRLQKTDKYTIGREARVPLQTSLTGGETTLGAAGGSLNAADPNNVDVGVYNLSYLYHQIDLEMGAIAQAAGGVDKTVVTAKALEVDNALLALQKSFSRQALMDGTALIAKCGTTSSSTTVVLNTSGTDLQDASHAIQIGWLRPGMTVSISTSASSDADVSNGTGVIIQSVTRSDTAPTFVVNGSGVTTTSSDFVKVTGARTGNTASKINEMMGFLGAFGTSGNTVGGLSNSDFAAWDPASVDTTTTAITLDTPLTLQKAAFKETGKMPSRGLTSIEQLTNLFSQLQTQQRFTGGTIATGNVLSLEVGTYTLEALPEVQQRVFYLYEPDDVLLCLAAGIPKPTWISDLQGTNQGLTWNAGNTNFSDAIVYPVGMAFRNRRRAAAATALANS